MQHRRQPLKVVLCSTRFYDISNRTLSFVLCSTKCHNTSRRCKEVLKALAKGVHIFIDFFQYGKCNCTLELRHVSPYCAATIKDSVNRNSQSCIVASVVEEIKQHEHSRLSGPGTSFIHNSLGTYGDGVQDVRPSGMSFMSGMDHCCD